MRERSMRNPHTLAFLYRKAQEDAAFRRFMGRALNMLFPAKDWKPYRGTA